MKFAVNKLLKVFDCVLYDNHIFLWLGIMAVCVVLCCVCRLEAQGVNMSHAETCSCG